MLLALDPDVFIAALHDIDIFQIICKFAVNNEHHQFASDGDKIDKEYLGVLFKYNQKSAEYSIFQKDFENILAFLAELIDPSSEYRVTIPSSRNHMLQKLIEKHHCTEEVEPELIGMVQNAPQNIPKIIMVGTLADQIKIRSRGLRDSQVYHKMQNHLKGLSVRFTHEAKFTPPGSHHQPPTSSQSKLFEFKVAYWLQSIDDHFKARYTPESVGHETDLYGYKNLAADNIELIIGECKLREEGNENKSISFGEIRQALKRIEAAAEYEFEKLRKKEIKKIHCLFVSNSQNFENSLEDFKESSASHINDNWSRKLVPDGTQIILTFLLADLPAIWRNDVNWIIKRLCPHVIWAIELKGLDYVINDCPKFDVHPSHWF